MSDQIEIWIISVSGYGSFAFKGNEADCAHMCKGKAQWEGSRGIYWKAIDATFSGNQKKIDIAATIDALISAAMYPNSIADKTNYGPAPALTACP